MKTILRTLLLGFLSLLIYKYAQTQTIPNVQMQQASGTELEFCARILAIDAFEIEASHLALKSSQNDFVKTFAQTVLDDHGKMVEELQLLIGKKNWKITAVDNKKYEDLLDALRNESSEGFDQKYVDVLKLSHQEGIDKFQEIISSNSADAELKDFAKRHLPALQAHFDNLATFTPAPSYP